MADVNVDVECTDPNELYGKGIRALILQNYEVATATLSKAAELLVAQHKDDMHEALGKVYLDYGKALLGYFREQSEALGDAVPRNSAEQTDEDDEEAGEEVDESEDDEDSPEEEPRVAATSSGQSESSEKAGTSSGKVEGDAAEEPEAEEEPNDLEVAWEVLELAKTIFKKSGDQKSLAETMVVLGEIQLENEACQKAIDDMKEGLAIQQELFGKDSRTIAETLYKLGMAYCINSQTEKSIQSFTESLEHLTNKVQALEAAEVLTQEAKEEIYEIKGLIPEIKDKITEMEIYKDEALKKAAEETKEEISSPASSGPSPSSSKKASDISHLVKRKRQSEVVDVSSEEVACKKRAVEVKN